MYLKFEVIKHKAVVLEEINSNQFRYRVSTLECYSEKIFEYENARKLKIEPFKDYSKAEKYYEECLEELRKELLTERPQESNVK